MCQGQDYSISMKGGKWDLCNITSHSTQLDQKRRSWPWDVVCLPLRMQCKAPGHSCKMHPTNLHGDAAMTAKCRTVQHGGRKGLMTGKKVSYVIMSAKCDCHGWMDGGVLHHFCSSKRAKYFYPKIPNDMYSKYTPLCQPPGYIHVQICCGKKWFDLN